MKLMDGSGGGSHNQVSLTGRLSSPAVERELPSGDRVVTFRIVVPRQRSPMTAGSRQPSDWVDCAVWGGRVGRAAGSWRVGDRVEVEGPSGAASSGPVRPRRREWRSRCWRDAAWNERRDDRSGIAEVPHHQAHPWLRAERGGLARHPLASRGGGHHLIE